jgi:hypothetical protein
MKITVNANDSAKIVATTIDEVEAKLRSEFPYAKLIYIEPDIFRSKSQQRSHDKLYSEKYKKAYNDFKERKIGPKKNGKEIFRLFDDQIKEFGKVTNDA